MKRNSLRSRIPDEIREELANDPYMVDCCVGIGCGGRIQWHHAFTYAGKRQNELWSILPLCEYHHAKAGTPHVSTLCNMNLRARICHFKAFDEFIKKYPKQTLIKDLR